MLCASINVAVYFLKYFIYQIYMQHSKVQLKSNLECLTDVMCLVEIENMNHIL